MIASRKSDQRHPLNLTIKNLTLSVCKDHQGAIHNFENVRESLRINYFAQLLIPVIRVTSLLNVTAHLFIKFWIDIRFSQSHLYLNLAN